MAMSQHKPCPGCHEIYNFGITFLGHHYYILDVSDLCLGVEKKIFREIQQFYTFYPQITSPLRRGPWNLQFLDSLPYRCYTPNLVKIAPVVLEKKMLTHEARRTMDNLPIAIGHLSDSGNLKKSFCVHIMKNKPMQCYPSFDWLIDYIVFTPYRQYFGHITAATLINGDHLWNLISFIYHLMTNIHTQYVK